MIQPYGCLFVQTGLLKLQTERSVLTGGSRSTMIVDMKELFTSFC
ncbi:MULTISPECIES: hypothetical protein [Candidatus Ichthyocystis]|nr:MULTISPECIES: hypothetical protein [Ichthyocystis]